MMNKKLIINYDYSILINCLIMNIYLYIYIYILICLVNISKHTYLKFLIIL